MSEENTTNEVVEKVPVAEPRQAAPMSPNDLRDVFNGGYASSLRQVYVNSLGREVGFKEITVKDQKTLSRIMIDNESRPDVVFDAQCKLINKVANEPFDIYECSEFDRLKLLIALYQANMFKNEVKFTCAECGCDNKFKLDFGNVLHRLDDINLEVKDFHYENDNWSFDFKCEYPSVKKVFAFKQSYAMKYRGANKRQAQSLDNLSNMEYINMFINEIKFARKDSPKDVKVVKMSDYKVAEIEGIVEVFPQDVLYSDNGVLKFIINEYIKKINDTFDVHTCYNCGAKYEGDVSSASSFF